MQKFKDILLIVAGISVLILAAVLRVVLRGRGLSGNAGQPSGTDAGAGLAGDANQRVGDALGDGRELAGDIKQSNSVSQRLARRGDELLAKAKHRDSNNGG